MTPLEIISRLCEITEELSGIVKKQQEMIERSKVEEGVKEELRNMVNEADGKQKKGNRPVVRPSDKVGIAYHDCPLCLERRRWGCF